jgi:hypothetical protein
MAIREIIFLIDLNSIPLILQKAVFQNYFLKIKQLPPSKARNQPKYPVKWGLKKFENRPVEGDKKSRLSFLGKRDFFCSVQE